MKTKHLFMGMCLFLFLLASCSQLVGPSQSATEQPTLQKATLSVETDLSRVQGVYINEKGARFDIVSQEGSDGTSVNCVEALQIVEVNQEPLATMASHLSARPEKLLKALVLGRRNDGFPGLWLIYKDDSIQAVQDNEEGGKSSKLAETKEMNWLLHGVFGWVYHAQQILGPDSQGGYIIVGYAENPKGFDLGRWEIKPGTTVAVYWRLAPYPHGFYRLSRARIIGQPSANYVKHWKEIDQDFHGESHRHHLYQFLHSVFSSFRLFFLDWFDIYLTNFISASYDKQKDVYLVTGPADGPAVKMKGQTGTATIKLDGIITITLEQIGEKTLSLAADINASGSSSPAGLTVFGGKLYFRANDGFSGAEPWSFDGTNAVQVADIRAGSASSTPRYLAVFGTGLYFQATDGSDFRLFCTSGSGATRVTDLYLPIYLTVFGGQLFMGAYDTPANGEELWRYDGTTAALVQDLNPGGLGGYPSYLTVYNNQLYFQADDGTTGKELYRSDGSSISLAADIPPSGSGSVPSFLTLFGSDLYFVANGDGYGAELWRFNGSSAARITDLNTSGDSLSTQSPMVVYDNALYFCADDGSTGVELWKYNGVTALRVADINPGTGHGLTQPASFAVYNGALYFGADDGTHGTELWSYNGSSVQMVKDINPAGSSFPKEFGVFNNKLYFQADNGTSGAELWVLY